MHRLYLTSLFCLTALFSITRTDAASSGNLLLNGDFENTQNTFVADGNDLMSLPAGSTVLPGWTVIDAGIIWVPNSNPYGPVTPSGTMFLDLTGYEDSLPYGGVSQSISTVPGQKYHVSVMVGTDQDVPAFRAPLAIGLIAGSVSNTFTFDPQSATGNVSMTFSTRFTATGATTAIAIIGASTAGGQYIGLDNVSFKAADGPELLQNGSFENIGGTFTPDSAGVESLQAGSTQIPGWTVTSAEIAWLSNTNRYGGSATTGSYFLDLTGYHDSPPYGGVAQTVTTTPGTEYTLSLALQSDQDVGAYRGPVSVTATIGSQQNTFTFVPPGTGNQWQTFGFDFQATGATTAISVIGKLATGGQHLGVDNVQVTSLFEISNVAAVNGNVTFDTPPGSYAVETTTDLGAPQWQPITLNATTHADGTATLAYPLNRSEKQRYFRLRSP